MQKNILSSPGAMSVDTFAQWAGIGRTTAWNQIKHGLLKARKVSARTIVTFDDARAWLAAKPDAYEVRALKRSGRTTAQGE